MTRPLPLRFLGDAICLSGGTGTGLKSELLGKYYPFWWGIASGGKSHNLNTAIIDLDAATGEVCIEDTGQTVLGSAGHALSLKLDNSGTENLRIILVEKDAECYSHLKGVLGRRWPQLPLAEVEGPVEKNATSVHIINDSLDVAINVVEKIDATARLGRTIFLFDPLLSVPWESIQKVARKRITSFYKIGTEFIIFLFTSDFFIGRDEFVPLPVTVDETKWNSLERASVSEADALFSGVWWRPFVLNALSIEEREARLVRLYRRRLHSWFRYVLPLPFAPKANQTYHLFFCSNFETGIRVTRSFFSELTRNPKYSPNNAASYERFRREHPNKASGFTGRAKPLEFRILWKTVKEHEEGFCDVMCQDLMVEERSPARRRAALEWLENEGYLRRQRFEDEWDSHPPTYMLRWELVKRRLGIEAPPPLSPLLPST